MSVDFESICRRVGSMNKTDLANAFPVRSKEVLEALSGLMHDEESGLEVFNDFMLASVAADGVLSIEEFFLLRPVMEMISGRSIEYDDAMNLFVNTGISDVEKFKSILRTMSEVYRKLPEELQAGLIEISAMVCACDSSISDDEWALLRNLAEPYGEFDAEKVMNDILKARRK